MARESAYAAFDADNHLYETEDAFTRHLPSTHRDLFRFVEIKGRKKLVVRNTITEFIRTRRSRSWRGQVRTWRSTPARTPKGSHCVS